MLDLVFLAYIAGWVLAARYVQRSPAWRPRISRVDGVAFVPSQTPAGCVMVLFMLGGAIVGGILPLPISEWFSHAPYRYRDNSFGDLDALGRVAAVVGATCGGYVGLRGSWLWTVLFLAGLGLYLATGLVGWVFTGHF